MIHLLETFKPHIEYRIMYTQYSQNPTSREHYYLLSIT